MRVPGKMRDMRVGRLESTIYDRQPLHTWPTHVHGNEMPMVRDRELLRLLRQMAMSMRYHDLSSMDQGFLNVASMEWVLPLDYDKRNTAISFLERHAEEVRL